MLSSEREKKVQIFTTWNLGGWFSCHVTFFLQQSQKKLTQPVAVQTSRVLRIPRGLKYLSYRHRVQILAQELISDDKHSGNMADAGS